MKKQTYDIFLEISNCEGKRLVEVLKGKVALKGPEFPFVPDRFFKTCFLRILVESRE
jgi:hypothetical protein